MKTSELTGKALNWAVAKCEEGEALAEGWHPHFAPYGGELRLRATPYAPSTDWAQGGPIIEREELSIEPQYTAGGLECWVAYGHNLRYTEQGNYIQGSDNRQYAPTPLIAAMRCYVASKLGDTIDIPEELK
jgi:hypothetical protein